MIRKKIFKRIMAIALMCILVIGSSTMVFAATTYSPWITATVYGQSYDFRAVCLEKYLISGNTLEAVTEIKTSDNANVPAGYMGANAILYDEYGNFVTGCSMVYNSNLSSVHYAHSPSITASGNYYACGHVKFYNGNNYTDFYTYNTPMASITSTGSQVEGIPASYYSYLDKMGDEDFEWPEWIPAKKQDGTIGLLRYEDLSPEDNVTTIEEALEWNKIAAYDRVIPMYNVDGEVIDEWVIPGTKEVDTEELKKELGD